MPPARRRSNTEAAKTALAERRPVEGKTLDQMIQEMMPRFQAAAPRGLEAVSLVRDAETAIRQVRNLAKCEPTSLLGALMNCAQLGLRPGPLKQVHLVPFYNTKRKRYEAQVIIDYRGYVALARRSGEIVKIIARTVYQGDHFQVRYGIDDTIEHTPRLDLDEEDRTPVAWYAFATYKDGGNSFVVIGPREVERAKQASQSGRKDEGPWVTDFIAMAEKTAIRRLARWLPLTVDLARGLAIDETVRTDLDEEAINLIPAVTPDRIVDGDIVDADTGEIRDEPDDQAEDAAEESPAPQEDQADPAANDKPITEKQLAAVHAALNDAGIKDRDEKLAWFTAQCGREITSSEQLTPTEAGHIIDLLNDKE